MKRISAAVALAGVLVGVPLVLLRLRGGPTIPSFHGVRLNDTYMPLDPVLGVLALVAWILWAYVAAVSVLRVLAVLLGGNSGRFVAASGALMPKPLRIWIDLAIGGALLAASFNPRMGSAFETGARAPAVTTASVKPRSLAPQASQSFKPLHEIYRVRPGDSLWRIAERKLGSGFHWREIFELNKHKRFDEGQRLSDPRLIRPGWILELPDRFAAARPHSTSSQNGRARVDVVPSKVARSVPETGPITVAQPPSRARPVTRLPSGLVIATSFASGVVSAELLRLLRRRRRYRPLTDSVDVPEESTLVREVRSAGAKPGASILDAAIAALADAWIQRFSEAPPLIAALEADRRVIAYLDRVDAQLPSEVGGNFSPRISFRTSDEMIVAEMTGPFSPHPAEIPPAHGLVPVCHSSDAVLHLSSLGLGVISFEGASAKSLVLQMLLAAATASTPEDMEAVLLGTFEELDIAKDLPHVRRVAPWDDASEALRDVQAELLRRARLCFDEATENVRAYRAKRPDDPLSDLVIVASPPPQALRGIVEAVGTEATRLGAALIAVGWTPDRSAVHAVVGERVEFDRLTFPHPKGFVPFTLDASAAHDSVAVVRGAQIVNAEPPTEEETSTQGVHDLLSDNESFGIERSDVQPQKPALDIASVTPSTLPPPKDDDVSCAELRCLGPIVVARSDGTIPGKGWRAPAKELLAYLALHPDGVHKERLAEEFFPGIPTKKALDLIARAASVVRTRVRVSGDDKKYVELDGETWRLERGAWQADVWEMERLIMRDALPAEAVCNLRTALGLYRGEFCDDAYFAWAQPSRERYRALFLRGSARLAELLCGAGEYEDALLVLDRAIEIEPLCEDLYRRAMAIETTLARRTEALERYGRLKRLLESELNCEPDTETESLAREVERSRLRESTASAAT